MIEIITKVNRTRQTSLSVFYTNIKQHVKRSILKMREELDEHLDSINANTNEIQANHESITRLELKIDKLTERLEEIQLHLRLDHAYTPDEEKTIRKILSQLTKKEQEIILGLFRATEEKGIIRYEDLERRLGLTEELLRNYITVLIDKGLPVIETTVNGDPYLTLDKRFKRLQIRENVLRIHEELRKITT